jgi:hypothetical protein
MTQLKGKGRRKTRAPLSAVVRYWNGPGRDRLLSFCEAKGYSSREVRAYKLNAKLCLCCELSGRTNRPNRIERAHIIPSAQGGDGEPDNLLPLCRTCHDLHPQVPLESFVFEYLLTEDIEVKIPEDAEILNLVFQDNKKEILRELFKRIGQPYKGNRDLHHPTKKVYTVLTFALIKEHKDYLAFQASLGEMFQEYEEKSKEPKVGPGGQLQLL